MPVIKKEQKQDLNQVSAIRINEISEAARKNELEKKTQEEKQLPEANKKYSDVIMARLTTGKRNIFKAFFCENGLTMNSGIEMCIEYVMDQVKSGNLKISKAGIK